MSSALPSKKLISEFCALVDSTELYTVEDIKYYTDRGVNINQKFTSAYECPCTSTALSIACNFRIKNNIKVLLKCGANVSCNLEGYSYINNILAPDKDLPFLNYKNQYEIQEMIEILFNYGCKNEILDWVFLYFISDNDKFRKHRRNTVI